MLQVFNGLWLIIANILPPVTDCQKTLYRPLIDTNIMPPIIEYLKYPISSDWLLLTLYPRDWLSQRKYHPWLIVENIVMPMADCHKHLKWLVYHKCDRDCDWLLQTLNSTCIFLWQVFNGCCKYLTACDWLSQTFYRLWLIVKNIVPPIDWHKYYAAHYLIS